MQHYQAVECAMQPWKISISVTVFRASIVQAMQAALLNGGDENAGSAPDYPLWTAAVSLSSSKAIFIIFCDES